MEICCFDECINYSFKQNVFVIQAEVVGGWKNAVYFENVYGKIKEGTSCFEPLNLALNDSQALQIQNFMEFQPNEVSEILKGKQGLLQDQLDQIWKFLINWKMKKD